MTPDQLTATREKLGMTKTELARELRVKWATVHQWELPLDHKQNRAIPGMVEAFLERLLKEKAGN
jgi:DNA-binding transcriptional regulator YiaG